jgi:hypothetical protein
MTYFKFVENLDQVNTVKNSVYKVSEKSYVINRNGFVFSCLGDVSYQLNDTLKNARVEMVLTCTNWQFTCIIK